jgi:hypothetical protein
MGDVNLLSSAILVRIELRGLEVIEIQDPICVRRILTGGRQVKRLSCAPVVDEFMSLRTGIPGVTDLTEGEYEECHNILVDDGRVVIGPFTEAQVESVLEILTELGVLQTFKVPSPEDFSDLE